MAGELCCHCGSIGAIRVGGTIGKTRIFSCADSDACHIRREVDGSLAILLELAVQTRNILKSISNHWEIELRRDTIWLIKRSKIGHVVAIFSSQGIILIKHMLDDYPYHTHEIHLSLFQSPPEELIQEIRTQLI